MACRRQWRCSNNAAAPAVNTRTGGSTFNNPPGRKAWQLIDEAGCRGLRRGDAQVSEMHCNFLVNHGADDPFIPEDAIDTFRKVLDEANVKYEFVAYPGARHSFTVPSADAVGSEGMKYDEQADKQSWEKMKMLFSRTLDG